MPAEPVTVVGGSWAALVAADALAARGRAVRLLLPRRGVGGGFVPQVRDGRVLELGLRVLELEHELEDRDSPAPPLAGYAPGATGHLPWLALVRAHLEQLAGDGLVTLGPARTVVDGRLADDLFLTSDPAGLRALPADDLRRAAEEVGPDGGAGLFERGLGDATLAEASRAHHGETVHARLIEPFAAKVVAGGSATVLARLRRRVWTPLLWPRSVWEATTGTPLSFRPRRPQRSVRPGGLGVLVEAQLARLTADPAVAIEQVGALTRVVPVGAATELTWDDGRTLTATAPVLAVPAAELFRATGIDYAPERARTVVGWLDVHLDDVLELPEVVHVADPALPALRVTSGSSPDDGPWRTVCVELRHDLDEAAIDAAARDSLIGGGLLTENARTRPIAGAARATFPLPTRANAEAFAAARDALRDREPGCEVIGGGADLAGDYLNEQVVAGLACGERRA